MSHPRAAGAWCAIDFGTSNSAVALAAGRRRASTAAGSTENFPTIGIDLVELEPGEVTMPTAVFYGTETSHDQPVRSYGREALAAYVDGLDGRLLRSMKSILGSGLVEQTTDLGAGHAVRYLDVISGFLAHLKSKAEEDAGGTLTHAVLGRPVFFVDDDAERDAAAQSSLEAAARAVGFGDVHFQYEPIAAALDHEQRAEREQLVLVADIGGGTSDFSIVRVGPLRRVRADRRDDILANHGVHLAGTDFDRHVELTCILPSCGFRGRTPGSPPREVPSKVYFDLATWHLINTVYLPQRLAELRRMRDFYADPRQHARLMHVVTNRLGHALAARAEAAKIDVANAGHAHIDLGLIEPELVSALDEARALRALNADLQRIAEAAAETARRAGLSPSKIDALYFTGGSTAFAPLVHRISALFPAAQAVRGDRHSSVARGLGLHAARLYGKR